MIYITIDGPHTAEVLHAAHDAAKAAYDVAGVANVNVIMKQACGEPIEGDYGPLGTCVLSAGHLEAHSPYGSPFPLTTTMRTRPA